MNTDRRSILKTILAAPLALLGIKLAKAEAGPVVQNAQHVPVCGKFYNGVLVERISWTCVKPALWLAIAVGRPWDGKNFGRGPYEADKSKPDEICWAGVSTRITDNLSECNRVRNAKDHVDVWHDKGVLSVTL